MLNFDDKTIYLACGITDMRKSINGLAARVDGAFNLDIYASAIFVFCNRHKDIIKILEFDGDGFWLHIKRLERGRFCWPTADEPTMTLRSEELNVLLRSPGIKQKLKREEIKPGTAFR